MIRHSILYMILSLSMIIMIGCGDDNSCKDEICMGDQRVSKCTNTKPENSHWGETNKNGTLVQSYNGKTFLPSTDSCAWKCNDTFMRKDNQCVASSDQDSDEDGINDLLDNCPTVINPSQEDIDNDNIGDVCDNCPQIKNNNQLDNDNDNIGNLCDSCPDDKNNNCQLNDKDNDGVKDSVDNCPNIKNINQSDRDNDGMGDLCDECPDDNTNHCNDIQNGTYEHPFVIDPSSTFYDTKDTNNATSDRLDRYPPDESNETGKEFFYKFTLTHTTKVEASITAPEPDGVDIDLHILKSVEPLVLLSRGHHEAGLTLEAGTYYLVMDSFKGRHGIYNLTVKFTQERAGTITEPINITLENLPFSYTDQRDTTNATSDYFNSYPPNTLNESGNEFIYHFHLTEKTKVSASLNPTYETDSVDIDLQLIKNLDNNAPQLIERGDNSLYQVLEAGDYYITADTFCDRNNINKAGLYELTITFRLPRENDNSQFFNFYILEAVETLNANYHLLGYDINSNLTHDIEYGISGINDSEHYGIINQTGVNNKTMCVSASMEIILTAMRIYVNETGDNTVYDFLPRNSWRRLGEDNIKGHIWVDTFSGGTADALHNFGMGDNYNFEELMPGSFINLNRTNGTGHAVTFLAFLDASGTEYDEYPNNINIIGFKYFSAQGHSAPGTGGFDYRWAIWSSSPTPSFCSYKHCDTGVMKKLSNQRYLNTGMMWHPSRWSHSKARLRDISKRKIIPGIIAADPKEWDGITSSDIKKQ